MDVHLFSRDDDFADQAHVQGSGLAEAIFERMSLPLSRAWGLRYDASWAWHPKEVHHGGIDP